MRPSEHVEVRSIKELQVLQCAIFGFQVHGCVVQAVKCFLEVATSGEVPGTKDQCTSSLCMVQQHACKRALRHAVHLQTNFN